MPILPQGSERYLRAPQFAGRELLLIAWFPAESRERVLRVELGDDGTPQREALGDSHSAIAAIDPEGTPIDARADDGAGQGDLLVRIDRDRGRSTVVLVRGGAEHRVWSAAGTASAPCVVAAGEGAWVAFHHDVREDNGEVDVAKWIALRYVDSEGRVFAAREPMRELDRDQEGEEQSFEFPSLAIGDDGAIALFGRGSHAFHRQELSGAGWSARTRLGDGVWGCRGRRVAVTKRGAMLLTARREKPGIAIDLVPMPSGGPPALEPAAIEIASKRPSAPLRPDRQKDPAMHDGRRTLFGDIHQHSAHSDGIGTADEPYLRARYAYGDDFCALSDHESFIGKRVGPGEWRHLTSAAERHDDPGRFATLLAYEWTGRMFPGPGHKVVYSPTADVPVLSRDAIPEGRDLVAAAKGIGAIAVPHHVGWTGADESAHDPAVQPVFEICSCHGCYESFGHALGQRGDLRDQMIDALLARGHRFGFIASSDGHGLLYHHGVARKRDPFRTGLCAVQARACTREAILEALRERRCYATSGAKILLDLRVNEAPMGSELRGVRIGEVKAEAWGTAPIERLELVGSAGCLAAIAGDGAHAALKARIADTYVYARVVQADGEMAWSSPVFMDH